MKLSIIIPTLRQKNEKGEEYIEILLKQIEQQQAEVIIIENKLVNSAWNEGVEKATGDIVFILNDDIIIQERVFETLETLQEGQVYCPFYSRGNNFNKIYSDNLNNIAGFCFGIYKKDWKPIPSDLKLRYGDNYIYEYMKHNILWGGYIHHWESKTLLNPTRKEQIQEIIKQDTINWKKYA